jgi:predicted AAA+ superfamily ATPase
MHINRSVLQGIVSEINKGHNILIDGHRFSGKTFLLASIIKEFQNRPTYRAITTLNQTDRNIFTNDVLSTCEKYNGKNELETMAQKVIEISQNNEWL